MRSFAVDFIEDANRARSLPDVFSLFDEAIGKTGFATYAFVATNPEAQAFAARSFNSPSGAIHLTYPQAFTQSYIENNYQAIDPLVTTTIGTTRALLWSEILAHQRLSRKQRRLFGEAAAAGLRQGMSVPFRGSMGGTYLVSLATSASDHPDPAAVTAAEVIATQYFCAFCRLSGAGGGGSDAVTLGREERECLIWTVKGKTPWQIAERLTLPHAQVRSTLKRAMRKLGACNRLLATIKAIELGIIVP